MKRFISGLILGAGTSSRLGQPKQLLPYRGTTLLGWVIEQTEQAGELDEVVVVLGRAADEIRERVPFGQTRVVDNPVFGEGCASSYRAGLAALNPACEAVMIILGDQPGVNPEIINQVAESWRASHSHIALASYQGRKGHPMIFAKTFFDRLSNLHGDKAAWKLIDANPDLICEVAFDRPFPEDIDTWEDFQRAIIPSESQ